MKITNITADIGAGVRRDLCLCVISDLHAKISPKLAVAVRGLSPDAVLMPGDIFDTCGRREDVMAFLSFLTNELKLPVFMSLGNHDRHIEERDRCEIAELGISLLDDSSTEFCGISICGLTSGFFSEYRSDVEKTPPPKHEVLRRFAALPSPRILLCHHPEYYPDYIRETEIELTVAGHAHGGQWELFGRGVFAPGQGLFPRYTAGVYDGGRLIVSRGVTNTVHIPRFFNPTEILLIKIPGHSA